MTKLQTSRGHMPGVRFATRYASLLCCWLENEYAMASFITGGDSVLPGMREGFLSSQRTLFLVRREQTQ